MFACDKSVVNKLLPALVLSSLLMVSGVSSYAQHCHSNSLHERPGFGRRVVSGPSLNPTNRWRSRAQHRLVNVSEINGWRKAHEKTSRDFELFANQLAVYWLMPHPAVSAAAESKLMGEVNVLRAKLAFLSQNRSNRMSMSYWRSQVQDLHLLTCRLDSLLPAAAPDPLVLQRWWTLRSDIGRWCNLCY